MTHTPGPWTVEGPQVSNRVVLPAADRVEIRADNGVQGTVAYLYRTNWQKDWDAGNARLIAAAPALLEALEAIVDDIAVIRDGKVVGVNVLSPNSHSLDFARAAIALAKGETNGHK